MKASERLELKLLIDSAARRRAGHAVGEGLCWWCESPLAGQQRKFCCELHKRYWWAKYTEAGARAIASATAQRRARRRQRQLLAEALR